MDNRGNKTWVVAVAALVVAVLLFAGGYGLGFLRGSSQPQATEASSQAASAPSATSSLHSASSQQAPQAAQPTAASSDSSSSHASPGATSSQVDVQKDEDPSSSSGLKDEAPLASSSKDAYETSGQSPGASVGAQGGVEVVEDGTYTSKDEVALYIHTYGHLPSNYITKTKAKKAGWVSSKGNLDDVLPGMSIGGSEFYNNEGQLPDASGRTWTECDIDYEGGFRGAKRIVFSNDGLIFYTGDHYKTFEQLY